MFKMYRHKGCLFECRLRYAASVVGCLPWDYPVPLGLEEIDTCLSWQNETNKLKQFHDAMDDPISMKNCQCMHDCEEVTYDIQKCFWKSSVIDGKDNTTDSISHLFLRLTH